MADDSQRVGAAVVTAAPAAAEVGLVNAAVGKVRTFYGSYAPWISLGLGITARALSHKDIDFAPKAVAILALAWLIPIAVTRWLHEPGPGQSEAKLHRLLRTASPTVTVLLYKNVLFFVVPVWFGSAHWPSWNVIAPALLAAMALFTCFGQAYRKSVLERPRVRVLWTAVVLFAATVPAMAVLLGTSPRTSIILSALLASVIAWAALAPREILLSKPGIARAVAIALPVAAGLGMAAPLLPPVPLVCHACAAGTAVVKRELAGMATTFPAGTTRVFAWFEISLPKHNREEVVFAWYRDGRPFGGHLRTKVEGGRKEGYRTWSLRVAPPPGEWRVDLLTGRSSQLIGRTEFVVAQ